MRLFLLIAWLGLFSWEDIRKKQVSLPAILLAAGCGVLCLILSGNPDWISVAAGAVPGAALAAGSAISRGKIGMGDAMVFLVSALYLGFRTNLLLFIAAMMISALYAMFLLISRRGTAGDSFPFLPCVLAAAVLLALKGETP
jgi:leader peptidase (prepilin peptidase)/N-methyltransferase